MATNDETVDALIAEVSGTQSVTVSNTSRSKANFSPKDMIEAARSLRRLNTPAARIKTKVV